MANPPPIEQKIQLRIDSAAFNRELNAALDQLRSETSKQISQLSTLQPGGLSASFNLDPIFNSLSRFSTALDALSAKVERLGVPAQALPAATTTSSAASLWEPASTTPALANALRGVGQYAYTNPETASSMAAVVAQLGRQEGLLRRLEGQGGAPADTVSAQMASLQHSLATIQAAKADIGQRLGSVDLAGVHSTLQQAVGAGQYGPVSFTPQERYALEAQRTAATLGAAESQASRLTQEFSSLNVTNSPGLGRMFEGGALGYAFGQQVSSGIGGALSPLEPLMGGNVLNGVGVAEQLAPLFNAATQGQRSPLPYAGVRQASTVAGMPLSSTLETSLGAQMASGISGGLVFFKNAADLFQFSQALGISAQTIAQVAGQAQLGGVSNFGQYFTGLMGTAQSTGLTNSAFMSSLAQLQSQLISAGLSPAGAQMPFGAFATAAHLAGINGNQGIALFGQANSAFGQVPANPFAAQIQTAAEQQWLKTQGSSLGFSAHTPIGQGLAFGIFQNTPLGQGASGAAKLLAESSVLTPYAQEAMNHHLSSGARSNAAMTFLYGSGFGATPTGETYMKMLANPATAHYLSGALHAEMGGGTPGLQSYLHDVSNAGTRSELSKFLNTYKGSPESNLQSLTATIQNAKLTLGNVTLAGEANAAHLPVPALGIGGMLLNMGQSALPIATGILGAQALGAIGGKIRALMSRGATAADAGAAADTAAAADAAAGGVATDAGVAAAGGAALGLGWLPPAAIGAGLIALTPGHGPTKTNGGPLAQFWNWLNTDPFAPPQHTSVLHHMLQPSPASQMGQAGNETIANLQIQSLKIDSLQMPHREIAATVGTPGSPSGGVFGGLQGSGGTTPATTGNALSNFAGNVIDSLTGTPSIPNTPMTSASLQALGKAYPALQPWMADIQKAHATYPNVPTSVIASEIMQESSGANGLTSSTGAQGLMQLEPGTAKSLGVKNSFNPAQNIMGGTHLLSLDLQQFHGNMAQALSAYYAGAGAVQQNGIAPYASYWQTSIDRAQSMSKLMQGAVQPLHLPTPHHESTQSAAPHSRDTEILRELKRIRKNTGHGLGQLGHSYLPTKHAG